MIEKLIRNSGCEYDEEIIKYGLITLCHGLLTMLILFILGILSNRVWETVLYLLNSFFVYTKIGGYHAKTSVGCICITVFNWGIAVFTTGIITKINKILWLVIGGTILLAIKKCAPVIHPNKIRYGQDVSIQYKRLIRIRVLIVYFLIIIFYMTNHHKLFEVLMISMIEIVISMIIGKEVYYGKNKGYKCDIKDCG